MAKNNNLTDFLTGVADAIRTKKGTTDLINPQDFESEILSIETGGGDQPTLFAPVITSGVNTVSWENNSSNGGFPVVISADIDGESVESPLTFTEDMDGKTLNVTANSDGFQEGISNVDLIYKHAGYSYLYINGYSECSGRFSFSLKSTNKIFSVNGVSSTSCSIRVNPRETVSISAEAYCAPDTDASISLGHSFGSWSSFESGFGTGSFAASSFTVNSKYTIKLIVYNNTTSSVWKNYKDSGYVSPGDGTSSSIFTVKAGNVYTFIWDITITAY